MREPGHPDAGDCSFFTLMIYLDAPRKGGATNFINEHDPSRVTTVAPSPGCGLVFEHRLLHEGALVKEGTKHALRTDVMYRRCGHPLAGTTGEHEHVLTPMPSSCDML